MSRFCPFWLTGLLLFSPLPLRAEIRPDPKPLFKWQELLDCELVVVAKLTEEAIRALQDG